MSEAPEQLLADRLDAAGFATGRFIDVQNGKKSSVDHEQGPPTVVDGNYGIYANGDDTLCILDIDDYDDLEDKSGISALHKLPATLEQGSPHGGTHRFYRVEPSDDGRLVAAALQDAFGANKDEGKGNLTPSWGEVRVNNQYVVGAGSQLDGCLKDWCDRCADEDGGYYVLQADREIATIEAEELIDVLSADPALSQETEKTDAGAGTKQTASPPDDVNERLSHAREHDDKLDRLMRGDYSAYGGDRSKAEYVLAYKLAFWLGDDRRTVRQVIEHDARTKKWDERPDDSYRDSVLAAVDDQAEFYEPASSPTDNSYAPDVDWEEVDRGQAILDAERGVTDPHGELIHEDGHYGYRFEQTDESGNPYTEFVSVTNFTLDLEHVIETYEGKLLTISVHPASPMEDPYSVQVHPTVFNSPATFTEEIVRGRTTYFNPQKNVTETLNNLRLTVGHQTAPEHVGTEYIGLHGRTYDEWVTPAGTLTADGWSDEPTHKYYEKGGDEEMESSLEDKWMLAPSDGGDFDDETVAAILERLPDVRKPDRGLPILGWFYAAPLKPIVHEEEGEFNLLQVTGDTEAGKTSTLQLFYQLFGADPAPFGCGDTNFTIEKKFAGSCGLPIWLDEYKPTDLSERKLNWLHRRLREVTREKSVSKGQQDLGEITFKMRAPVVFSGEQTVTEAAVRRRAVMTHLTDQATEGRHEQAFCELVGASYTNDDGSEQYPAGYDLADHALAFYRFALSKGPDELRAAWHEARSTTRDHLQSLGVADLDGSEFQGLQTIVFGVDVYRAFAEAYGVDHAALPDGAAVQRALAHVVSNIGPEGRRREHIDEFVELMAQAAAAGYLEEGVHHRVYEPQMADEEALAFHMPTTFDSVKKYAREYNVEDEYSLLGKNDYLDSFRDKADQGGSYPLSVNHRVRGIENGSKAVVIDPYRAASILRGGFNLSAFTAERSPDDTTDATAIEAVSADGNPYTTVTAEVVQWDDGPDGTTIAKMGVVSDATAPIDVVDYDGSLELDEETCYRLEDVRASRYDGSLQLEIVPGATRAVEIQEGVGHTSPDDDGESGDVDEGQQASLDGSTESAAADGGAEVLTEEIDEAIKKWTTAKSDGHGAKHDAVVAAVADDLDVATEKVEHRIEKLTSQGDIYEPQTGHYRTT